MNSNDMLRYMDEVIQDEIKRHEKAIGKLKAKRNSIDEKIKRREKLIRLLKEK